MQTKPFLILSLFCISIGCDSSSQQAGAATINANTFIKGKFANTPPVAVYTEALLPSGVTPLDTVQTGEDGSFSLALEVKETGFYRIKLANNNFITIILQPKDNVSIQADAHQLETTYEITGSEESGRLKEFNRHAMGLYKLNDSLSNALRNHQTNNDITNYNAALAIQQTIPGEFQKFVKSFIDQKPGSFASMAAVQNLDPEQNIEYFIRVEEAIHKSFPESGYYKDLKAKLDQLTRLSIGSPAPEIALNDTAGKPFKLSALRGKYVLLDFWASWCRPCRMENPNVVKLYKKYHPKGLEILGVSLDKDKTAWTNAIKQDGLIWKHISDLGFWNSAAAKLYEVKGIPQTFLLDKEGKIIGKNLRGPELEQKMEELLGK